MKNNNTIKRITALLLSVLMLLVTAAPASAAGEEDAEKMRILIVGNSKIYFNNLPYMLSELVRLGRNVSAEVDAFTWGGAKTTENARRLEAAVSSGGDIYSFDMSRAREFLLDTGSASAEHVYEYISVTLFENGAPKKYDVIILQDTFNSHYPDGTLPFDGVYSIVSAFAAENTRVILDSAWPNEMVSNAESLAEAVEHQKAGNDVAEKTLALLKASELSFDREGSLVCPAGNAFLNYYHSFGFTTAMKLERQLFPPKAYNDLMLADLIHPTQYGTLLEALCLYDTVFRAPSCGIGYDGRIGTFTDQSGLPRVLCTENLASGRAGQNTCIRMEGGREYSCAVLSETLIRNLELTADSACLFGVFITD